jgi:TRAP-type C4-dicarboxylate transport system substrate-binding protein
VVSINRKTYLRLPAEVREAVQLAAIDYRNALAADTTLQATKSRAEYVRQGGEIIHVTPQQRKEWAMALPNLAREWADAMEQSGYPGHTILRDYMDLMRAKEENIMRDWDKE